MASGDSLLQADARAFGFPGSDYPQLDQRNNHDVLDFDATTQETAFLKAVLPQNYAGGGITVYIHYSMSSATSGNVSLEAAFERIGDGQQDVDSDSFATAQTTNPAVPGTSGHVDIASIAFTDGAQIDSIAVGEAFRLSIARDADGTNGTDDAAGDMEVHHVTLRES